MEGIGPRPSMEALQVAGHAHHSAIVMWWSLSSSVRFPSPMLACLHAIVGFGVVLGVVAWSRGGEGVCRCPSVRVCLRIGPTMWTCPVMVPFASTTIPRSSHWDVVLPSKLPLLLCAIRLLCLLHPGLPPRPSGILPLPRRGSLPGPNPTGWETG